MIHVTCSCGARITLRDRAAGSVLACPRCGRESTVPEPEERIPCPFCAEPILPEARICPFCRAALGQGAIHTCIECGVVNPGALRECRRCGVPFPAAPPPGPAPALREEGLRPLDWVLGLAFPCLGIFLGFAHLCCGRGERGGKTIALSLVGFAVWGFLTTL